MLYLIYLETVIRFKNVNSLQMFKQCNTFIQVFKTIQKYDTHKIVTKFHMSADDAKLLEQMILEIIKKKEFEQVCY